MEDKPIKCPCTKDCQGRWEECHKFCHQYKEYEQDKRNRIEKRMLKVSSVPEMTPKMKRYIAKKRKWK